MCKAAMLSLVCSFVVAIAKAPRRKLYAGAVCFTTPQCTADDLEIINAQGFSETMNKAAAQGFGQKAKAIEKMNELMPKSANGPGALTETCTTCMAESVECGFKNCAQLYCMKGGPTAPDCLGCGWANCSAVDLCGIKESDLDDTKSNGAKRAVKCKTTDGVAGGSTPTPTPAAASPSPTPSAASPSPTPEPAADSTSSAAYTIHGEGLSLLWVSLAAFFASRLS